MKFDFEIPIAQNGDCYDRAVVRVEEMRQSLRIVEQCLNNMPEGSYKADHPLTTPPMKKHTMQDIETLITHFLNVSWGPVIPAGEAMSCIEATKGANSYYLISDGNTSPYVYGFVLRHFRICKWYRISAKDILWLIC